MIAAVPVDEIRHAQAALAQQPDDLHPEIFPRPRIDRDRAGILAAMHRDAIGECRQTEDRVRQLRFDAARNRVDDQRVGVERQMKGVLFSVAGGDEGDVTVCVGNRASAETRPYVP